LIQVIGLSAYKEKFGDYSLSLWERAGVRGEATETREDEFGFLRA